MVAVSCCHAPPKKSCIEDCMKRPLSPNDRNVWGFSPHRCFFGCDVLFFCFLCVFVDVKRPYYYYCCCCYYYYYCCYYYYYYYYYYPLYYYKTPLTPIQPFNPISMRLSCVYVNCIAINPRLPFQLTAQAISQNSFIENFVKTLNVIYICHHLSECCNTQVFAVLAVLCAVHSTFLSIVPFC